MARTKKRRTKGSGRVLHAGRTWAIRYTEDGVRKYAGGYLTKDKADQALANITAEISTGRPGVPKPPKASPLFRDLVDDFMDQREANANAAEDRKRWDGHLDRWLSPRRLEDVDAALISDIVTGMRKTRARTGAGKEKLDAAGKPKTLDGATIERTLYLLSAFFRWAIRLNHATVNPVTNYLKSLERRERKRIRSAHDPKDTPFVETKAEIAKIFRALPEPVNIAYALSALAGLRPGEALALEWADVDLTRGRITVSKQVRNGKVGPTKSGKPRDVDMVPALRELLTTWRERTPGSLVVRPMVGAKHLGPKTVTKALKAALAALELPALSFYQAGRHTFASQWVIAGLDVYRLSEIMGHSSVVTTQRYAHLTKTTPADVLARADVAL